VNRNRVHLRGRGEVRQAKQRSLPFAIIPIHRGDLPSRPVRICLLLHGVTWQSKVRRQMKGYILVVDDEPALRFAVRSYLESAGYEVEEATNGVEALRCIAHRKPDLVILDVLMSPMSGWEVLELLNSSPETRDIRVVILTAMALDRDEALGWHMGCDWYEIKRKPLQFDDLGLVVNRLLAIDPHEEEKALAAVGDKTEGGK
jgi:CheY-like chemotaxis protein